MRAGMLPPVRTRLVRPAAHGALLIAACLALAACAVQRSSGDGFGDALRAEVRRDLGARSADATPATLNAFYALYVRELARLDPQFATRAGLHDHDGRLTRYDDASYEARVCPKPHPARSTIQPMPEERKRRRRIIQ
jgi:hypothetical protein